VPHERNAVAVKKAGKPVVRPLRELRGELVILLLEAPLGNDKTITTAKFASNGVLEGGQIGPAPALIAAEAVEEADQLGGLSQGEAPLGAPI
jgi:hypothetical protein